MEATTYRSGVVSVVRRPRHNVSWRCWRYDGGTSLSRWCGQGEGHVVLRSGHGLAAGCPGGSSILSALARHVVSARILVAFAVSIVLAFIPHFRFGGDSRRRSAGMAGAVFVVVRRCLAVALDGIGRWLMRTGTTCSESARAAAHGCCRGKPRIRQFAIVHTPHATDHSGSAGIHACQTHLPQRTAAVTLAWRRDAARGSSHGRGGRQAYWYGLFVVLLRAASAGPPALAHHTGYVEDTPGVFAGSCGGGCVTGGGCGQGDGAVACTLWPRCRQAAQGGHFCFGDDCHRLGCASRPARCCAVPGGAASGPIACISDGHGGVSAVSACSRVTSFCGLAKRYDPWSFSAGGLCRGGRLQLSVRSM